MNSNAEVFVVLVKDLAEWKIENAFKLVLFNSELNCLEADEFAAKIKEFTNVLAIMALSYAHLHVQVRELELALMFASISGHLMVHLIDSQDFVVRILSQRFEALSKEYSGIAELRGFLDEFNQIIGSVKDKSIIARVSFEDITEECLTIRKLKEQFDPYHSNLAIGENDIAAKCTKAKSIQDVGLRQWVKLHEDLKRTRNYSERIFKDVEQKIVISKN